jgi:tRNA threonylcarbamoyladenosine biosynthesis protein TsaB
MKNLAIECSGSAGSVALSDAQSLLEFVELTPTIGSVQTLAPALQEIVRQFGPPDLISVTAGPGSFTGLRVGLSTAKMLAMAWGIPIVAVDALQAISLRVANSSALSSIEKSGRVVILPIINAFRGQVFAAAHGFEDNANMTEIAVSQVSDAGIWSAEPVRALGLEGIDDNTTLMLAGPGLRTLTISGYWQAHRAPDELWNPTAIEVGELGWHGYKQGRSTDPDRLRPNYLRASAAEEKARP